MSSMMGRKSAVMAGTVGTETAFATIRYPLAGWVSYYVPCQIRSDGDSSAEEMGMIWGANLSRVARAMREVRREYFLPAAQRRHAEKDTALPIGSEQTISQPSLVAQMTEQLEL